MIVPARRRGRARTEVAPVAPEAAPARRARRRAGAAATTTGSTTHAATVRIIYVLYCSLLQVLQRYIIIRVLCSHKCSRTFANCSRTLFTNQRVRLRNPPAARLFANRAVREHVRERVRLYDMHQQAAVFANTQSVLPALGEHLRRNYRAGPAGISVGGASRDRRPARARRPAWAQRSLSQLATTRTDHMRNGNGLISGRGGETYNLGSAHGAFANMPVRELFANTFVYQPAVRTPSFANSGVREPFASVCLP